MSRSTMLKHNRRKVDKKIIILLISNNVNTIHETTITKWLPKSVYAINDLENVNYVSMRNAKQHQKSVNVMFMVCTYLYDTLGCFASV